MRKIIFICLIFLCGCAAMTESRLDSIQNKFANSDFSLVSDKPHLKTGLSVWEDEQPIIKQGTHAPTW